jgi:hypothetical protein
MKTKKIIINWNNATSIVTAEKRKQTLENRGYKLIHTTNGINTNILTYTL